MAVRVRVLAEAEARAVRHHADEEPEVGAVREPRREEAVAAPAARRDPGRVLGRRRRLVLAAVEVRARAGLKLPGPPSLLKRVPPPCVSSTTAWPAAPTTRSRVPLGLPVVLTRSSPPPRYTCTSTVSFSCSVRSKPGSPARLAVGRARPRPHERVAAAALDLDELGAVGQVDLDLLREVLVEGLRAASQLVTAALEVAAQPPGVERDVLGRLPAQRLVDHGVRDPRLQLGRGLAERLPLQAGEQLAVLLAAVPGEALHGRVVGVVALEEGRAGAGEARHEAVVAREGLVAVVRDRLPQRLVGELRPAPLVAVPVPVADHEVEEPGLQERPRVGACLSGGEALVELLVLEDLDRSLESRIAIGLGARVLEELPTSPANSLRNSPSRASSGIATNLDSVCRMPAASISPSTTRKAEGELAAIWSCTRPRAQVSRSSSGRMLVGSLSTPRKV